MDGFCAIQKWRDKGIAIQYEVRIENDIWSAANLMTEDKIHNTN